MKRMILVDGNSLMYRAYFGIADTQSLKPNSKGIFTNAIMSFARMMHNLLKSEYDNVLVAFDAGKHTLRHNLMPDYKAGRASMPDEMRMQIAHIKNFLDISNIKRLEMPEYEADDIIGTMAKMAENAGYHVDIYSSDKDLLQLISSNSTVHLTKKGMNDLEDFDIDHFKEVYNLEVEQFIDLKALMGDKSDNISGVPGIGPKKAIKYLTDYKTVEGIIENIDSLKGKDKENFANNRDLALVCKKMVTILRDAPIGISIEDTQRKEPDIAKLTEFYEYLELPSLLKELRSQTPRSQVYSQEYKVINTKEELKEILLPNSALIFETLDYNYHRSPLLYIGLKNTKGNFILTSEATKDSLDFKLFIEDKENHKSIYDYKRAYVELKKLGLTLLGVDYDMLLAAYVINPSITRDEFKMVASSFDYYDLLFDEEVYGKGAKRHIPEPSLIFEHIVKKAECLYLLKNQIINRLKEAEQYSLLVDIEIPLSRILGEMEFTGVKVDMDELNRQKLDLTKRIEEIEASIYSLARKTFNISSPKQLGTVLFEDLGLPAPKKTKTGYSTDQETLQSIIRLHPIIEKILSYRQLTKLYQTYIEGLEGQIFEDGKVHTIYQQALTQTGRLSSIEPNLQNIPIRTEEGRNIRKMYIPSCKENTFFSADYSQIELRVLAHMANVKKLIEAFNNNEDIHTKTAQEIFNKPEITSDDRRKAKAVNFGIVYGISAYGLATDIGISNIEAAEYIKRYYQIYPEIKEFMEQTIEFCKENGYVKTIKNRIRWIPDINSKVYTLREFAKRTAMNAPIQGSAADILKIAMINIFNRLENDGYKSKMLLQIHDELLFEVAKGEEEKLSEMVQYEMKNAVKLHVALDVSHDFGKNWYEVK